MEKIKPEDLKVSDISVGGNCELLAPKKKKILGLITLSSTPHECSQETHNAAMKALSPTLLCDKSASKALNVVKECGQQKGLKN